MQTAPCRACGALGSHCTARRISCRHMRAAGGPGIWRPGACIGSELQRAQLAGHDRRCDDAVHLRAAHHRPRVAGCRAQRSEGGDGPGDLPSGSMLIRCTGRRWLGTMWWPALRPSPTVSGPLAGGRSAIGVQTTLGRSASSCAALARWRLQSSASSPPTSCDGGGVTPQPPARDRHRGARPAACGACWGRSVSDRIPLQANQKHADGPLTQGVPPIAA